MISYTEYLQLMESASQHFRQHFANILHQGGFKSHNSTRIHLPDHHVNHMLRHIPTHHRVSGGQTHFHHPDGHVAVLSDHVLNIKHHGSEHSIDIHRDKLAPGSNLATTVPHHAVKSMGAASLLHIAKLHSTKMANASHKAGIGVSHLTHRHL